MSEQKWPNPPLNQTILGKFYDWEFYRKGHVQEDLIRGASILIFVYKDFDNQDKHRQIRPGFVYQE